MRSTDIYPIGKCGQTVQTMLVVYWFQCAFLYVFPKEDITLVTSAHAHYAQYRHPSSSTMSNVHQNISRVSSF